jgi:hypothetical protein
MKILITLLLTVLFFGCTIDKNFQFIGQVISAETNGKIIEVNQEKYIIVNALIKIIEEDSNLIKKNQTIKIEFRLMQTNLGIETVKSDDFLNYNLEEGNIIHINVIKHKGKYYEEVYSVQDAPYPVK